MKNIDQDTLIRMNQEIEVLDQELNIFFRSGPEREFDLQTLAQVQRYCDLRDQVEDMKKIGIITKDGQKVTGVIVTKEDHEKWERERLERVAEACTPGQLEALKAAAQGVVDSKIDVSDYVKRSSEVAGLCKLLWEHVGSPNLFHNYRKGIDPEIYGRPETLRADCQRLIDDLRKVLKIYDENINSLEIRSDCPFWKRGDGTRAEEKKGR